MKRFLILCLMLSMNLFAISELDETQDDFARKVMVILDENNHSIELYSVDSIPTNEVELAELTSQISEDQRIAESIDLQNLAPSELDQDQSSAAYYFSHSSYSCSWGLFRSKCRRSSGSANYLTGYRTSTISERSRGWFSKSGFTFHRRGHVTDFANVVSYSPSGWGKKYGFYALY